MKKILPDISMGCNESISFDPGCARSILIRVENLSESGGWNVFETPAY